MSVKYVILDALSNSVQFHKHVEQHLRKATILFIHSFILPLTRNTTTVYRNTLKIIYNIATKLFTRLNVVKARKPI